MTETLWRVFGLVGMVVLGVVIALWCIFVIEAINDDIKTRRRRYELQHRFDKPPLAKCYCKDCSWRSGAGLCDKLDCYVNQDFFCKHADPCDKEVKQE